MRPSSCRRNAGTPLPRRPGRSRTLRRPDRRAGHRSRRDVARGCGAIVLDAGDQLTDVAWSPGRISTSSATGQSAASLDSAAMVERTAGRTRGDLQGGVVSAVLGLPESMAYGAVVFAPLGPAYAPLGVLAGLIGLCFSNLVPGLY